MGDICQNGKEDYFQTSWEPGGHSLQHTGTFVHGFVSADHFCAAETQNAYAYAQFDWTEPFSIAKVHFSGPVEPPQKPHASVSMSEICNG